MLVDAAVEGTVRVVCVGHEEPRSTLRAGEELPGLGAVDLWVAAHAQLGHVDGRVPPEALDRRQVRDLAEDPAVVSLLGEEGREQRNTVCDGLEALGPVAVRPPPGHDRGPARLTDRRGHVGAAEHHALTGEGVDARGDTGRAPEDPGGAGVHVIEGDEQNVDRWCDWC